MSKDHGKPTHGSHGQQGGGQQQGGGGQQQGDHGRGGQQQQQQQQQQVEPGHQDVTDWDKIPPKKR